MPALPLRPAPDPTPVLSTLSRTLSDVRTFQLPRLRGCTSSLLASDLAAEARADLEGVRSGLEESREACEALPEASRAAVLQMWEGVEEEYLAARDEFRAALVESKRAAVAAARKHELLDPAPDEVPRAEPVVGVGGDDALQTKTNEVTDAMRRTAQLLQTELERSVLSTQMLDESTRTLRTTHGLYDNYTALLTTSSQLVRALERADWWDRVLIMGALGFFLLCVAYIVKRRVLDRVGGLAVWWVGGSYRLLKMIGRGGGGGSAAGAAGGAVTKARDGIVGGSIAASAAAAAAASAAAAAAAAGAGAGAGAKLAGGGGGVGGRLAGAGADAPGVDVGAFEAGVGIDAKVGVAEVGAAAGTGAAVGHVPVPEVGAGKGAVEEEDGDAHGEQAERGEERQRAEERERVAARNGGRTGWGERGGEEVRVEL